MFCPKCGAQTQSGARFCHACGTSLAVEGSVRAQNVSEPRPKHASKSVSQTAVDRSEIPKRESPHESPPSPLPELASSRPDIVFALALVVVIAAIIVVAVVTEGSSRAASYGEGAGGALALAISSPVSAFPASVVNQLLTWVLIRSSRRSWMTYKATLFAYLWAGLAGMFSWGVAALADSEVIGALVGLPVVLAGMAWVFGSFIRGACDEPLGLGFGVKLVGLQILAVVLLGGAVLAVPALLAGPR